MVWMYIAALLTGILASLGVGGGMILIIYLTAFANMPQLEAQGVNLVFFIPIAALSVTIHTKNKLIEWRKLVPSIIAGLAFAAAGVFLADYIGSPMLSKIFAGLIILVGVKEFFYKPNQSDSS
ncbi:MAG: sulfite exporter TauE/SafE family protein [Oscillospiraceae bacterium]|nr:sulfite exporter TauE/SafE family protein [Oscillospiraceae bacterium]